MYKPGQKITVKDVAFHLDHSLLRPDITMQELKEGIDVAIKYNCVSVCVRPSDIPVVKEQLKGTDVLLTTVLAFPHGGTTTNTKVAEAIDCIEKGAVEVDMVLHIGRMLSGEYDYVQADIKAVVDAAHKRGIDVKVITENCFLTDEQIEKACEICINAGADYVKTSTGYGGGGSTLEDLKLMRRVSGDDIKVKAAGGVRTLDQALAVIATGTVRIGTRSSKIILEEADERAKSGELCMPL
jgi:deoxyribose-phosphate aldolase